jgi:phosphatidylglycerol lysyltransferase
VEHLHADLKNTHQRFKDKEDYTFDVIPAGGVEPHLKELRDVSESWLSKHKAREKGFSTGFFHADYLKRAPLAVIRKEGKIMVFANLLQGHGKEEVSVDLLRSVEEATKPLEDHLILEIMLWAKEKGIHWFDLGPAGLLDIGESPLAPFEIQMTEILSPYVRVSNLMEIRKDKERFDPEWSPKYLASSGNLSLDVAFNNIRSLISRGNRAGSKR